MRRSNCKSRMIRRNKNFCSSDKNILDSPDCLPDGWTMEVKFRKSGPKVGAKYKCYIAPITGCKFYSKKDVARYLNSEMASNYRPKLKEIDADMSSGDNVVVERKNLVNGLPPGWVQEMKVRKSGDRRDPYYTHPGSEYVFRSKKDVIRYVEFGKVGRHAMKRKKESINNVKVVEKFTSSPSAVKRQKLEVRARGRYLFTEEGSSVSNSKEVQILEPVVPKGDIPLSRDAPDHCEECNDLSGFILIENKDPEEKQITPVCTENEAVLAPPLDNGVEMCTGSQTQRRKRKNKKDLNVPRRASERLAALRAARSPKLETSDQVHQVAAHQPLPLKADLPINSIKNSQAHRLEKLSQLESNPETSMIPHASKVTYEGEIISKCRSSLGAGLQSNESAMGQSTREEPSNEFEKLDCDQLWSGRHEPGGEKVDGKPESPLVLPFGDSWPDPCLEFAFKTLTGLIPLEENLAVEDYLKQQLNSDHTNKTNECAQPGFVTDGICRADLFKFDSLVKPSDLPEMQWTPAFSTSGNENRLNFGNNVLQWNEERKK